MDIKKGLDKKSNFRRTAFGWLLDKVWSTIDPQEYLFHLELDITNACNLACTHCYLPHHKNRGALSFEDWCRVVDQYDDFLSKLHMKPCISIGGGEPFLAPFLFPLIEYIRERFPNCEINIGSNGTRIDYNIAQRLKESNVSVQVSIDGPDAWRHDLIRGMGNFDKTLEGCRALNKSGVPFHHLAVLSKRTSPWIPDFFEMAKQTGAFEMNFVRMVTVGYAEKLVAEGKDGPLKGLALKEAMENILRFSRLKDVSTNTKKSLWHLIEPDLGAPNNIGFSGLVVDYQGRVKVSARVSSIIGNVFEEGGLRLKNR
jgi:MoaA/NifB/PqqE/SkfB family radical SAM enzyme